MADVRLGDAVKHGGLSRRIIAALVVEFLLVVGGLTTAVVLAHNSSTKSGPVGTLVGSNSKSLALDQADAVAAAQRFVLTMDGFTPNDVKGYLAKLMPMLTTKAQADANTQYGQLSQLAGSSLTQLSQDPQAAALGSVGLVEFAALQNYSSTAATVMVAHDMLYGGVKQADCAAKPDYCQTYRWAVSLRKINGIWLVDTFNQNPTA